MKRNTVYLFAAASMLFLLALPSCNKDQLQPGQTTNLQKPLNSTDRGGSTFYGVSVFDGVNACRVIGIDKTTQTITTNVNAFYVDPLGNTINLLNLKGICLTSWGQYFITTGNPVTPGVAPEYSNALFKIDPTTGQCSLASTNPDGNTVSDLEHDPATQNFYGLLDNSNAIIEISNANNNNYGDYSTPMDVTNIKDGYTLKGLSLVNDASGVYFVGCASDDIGGDPAQLYTIPITGGPATFMTDLDPIGGWVGGNCGIGFQYDQNLMYINRNAWIVNPGMNFFKWHTPFPISLHTNWLGGADDHDYEDLTSDIN